MQETAENLSKRLLISYLNKNFMLLLSDRIALSYPQVLEKENNEKSQVIMDKLNSYIISMKEDLGNENKREKSVEELYSLRSEIISIYRDFMDYIGYWNVVAEYVSDTIYKLAAPSVWGNFDGVNKNAFLSDCKELLEDMEDDLFVGGALLSAIPMTLTRERFYEILSEDFLKSFKDGDCYEVKNIFLTHKFFYLAKPTEKNIRITEIDTMIDELLALDKKEEDYVNKASSLHDGIDGLIQDISMFYEDLYAIINEILTIYFVNLPIEEVTLSDYKIMDFYYSICENIKSKDNIMLDIIEEAISEEAEKSIDAHEQIVKKVKNIKGDMNEDTKLYLDIYNHVAELNTNIANAAYINEFSGTDEKRPITDAELKNLTDSFIADIKDFFKPLQAPIRKMYMKNIFSTTSIAWDNDKILDYIKDALDSTLDSASLALILDKVSRVFTRYGYEGSDVGGVEGLEF